MRQSIVKFAQARLIARYFRDLRITNHLEKNWPIALWPGGVCRTGRLEMGSRRKNRKTVFNEPKEKISRVAQSIATMTSVDFATA
jgi:hypothetical protein